ncbi:DNA alkylation repair protein [Sphingopyxis sp. EG6]|uniref:DNA alkylation repair protein n=1 Tax=Sphingopyxis sp. EG6 TaxID=1874061 RepID=UPI000DC61EEA|nr:DNA alkylation repair protein [Sphingopyxis sp. EG6]BBB07854.1 DNA alkylation repair enzyme-like protein [Sphingopyxis sp. EG6]
MGPQALATIADAGAAASPRFDREVFVAAASDGLQALSIMERVRHIADALRPALPSDYDAALGVITVMAPRLSHGFQAVAVTEYVARYGLDDFDRSMEALAALTRFGTAEFAIRPFLALDADRALATMAGWTASDDEHVRRLASEGARPRLPWAARVPALKADPTRAAPILEALKADSAIYVRKSVANHLNDIAKDQPDWLLDRLADWPQDDPHTAWIIRHALRTLIKQGEPRALALIGVGHGAAVTIGKFVVEPAVVRLGERIAISVDIASTAAENQPLVVDYRVHYARGGGKTAAKVFKWKSFDLAAGESAALRISQVIRDFSTRRHHPGRHAIELIVNGETMGESGFELLADGAQ